MLIFYRFEPFSSSDYSSDSMPKLVLFSPDAALFSKKDNICMTNAVFFFIPFFHLLPHRNIEELNLSGL